jgi:hypothetical protein
MWQLITVVLCTEAPRSNERLSAGDRRELARWEVCWCDNPLVGCDGYRIPEVKGATTLAIIPHSADAATRDRVQTVKELRESAMDRWLDWNGI